MEAFEYNLQSELRYNIYEENIPELQNYLWQKEFNREQLKIYTKQVGKKQRLFTETDNSNIIVFNDTARISCLTESSIDLDEASPFYGFYITFAARLNTEEIKIYYLVASDNIEYTAELTWNNGIKATVETDGNVHELDLSALVELYEEIKDQDLRLLFAQKTLYKKLREFVLGSKSKDNAFQKKSQTQNKV